MSTTKGIIRTVQVIEPDSSVIARMEYEHSSEELRVEFVEGAVYTYTVDEIVWDVICKSHERGNSVGRAYNHLVRHRPATKVA